jgi:CRISPR/Cas system endoribonuclease Cas6 (RAMP superfamily)
MAKNNNFVFIVLSIVAWVIFVGLCIEAGALLVNFFISLYKPEFVQNLYQKLDLSQMYTMNKMAFFQYVLFYFGHRHSESILILYSHPSDTQT